MTREETLHLLGHFPEMSSKPSTRTFYKTKRGIKYYSVSYEAEPGETIRAWLLIPEQAKNCPAIVACHQHGDEFFIGKSEPVGFYAKAANTFGLSLCHAGYVVICPDQLGFEERRPAEYIRKANPFQEGQNYERQLFMEYLLHGSTLQAKNIADLTRAVDVLLEQPEVDPNRIGVCGHSLGGQEALWLAWYDFRIKVMVSSCGFSMIGDLQKLGINQNYSMYLPNFLEYGDMDDILAALCPRPALVCHGANDTLYPRDTVEKVCKKARACYDAAGYSERLRTIVFEETGHIFEEPQQVEAIAFFMRWL